MGVDFWVIWAADFDTDIRNEVRRQTAAYRYENHNKYLLSPLNLCDGHGRRAGRWAS